MYDNHHRLCETVCIYMVGRISNSRKEEGKVNLATVGKWAFIVGLIIAGIAGLFFEAAWVVWVLVLLGVVVGLLNITAEEVEHFLLAAIAFLLSATALGAIPFIGGRLDNILGYVAAFVSGAVIVVALQALFKTAR